MMKTHPVQVDNWTIHTVRAGSGPPILFVHGIGLSSPWWRPAMEALSEQFSVCAIDLPGCGRSSPVTAPPAPESYRLLFEGVVNSLGLGPAVVVAHSLGGYVATQAAVQHSPAVKALVLVDSGGFGQVANWMLRLLSWPMAGDLLMRLGWPTPLLQSMVRDHRTITAEDIAASRLSTVEQQQFLYLLRLGLRRGETMESALIPNPSPLSIPALIVWGRYDSVFPVENAYRAERVLNISRPPVIFEQSGHWPPREETQRFNDILRRFCIEVLL